MKHQLKNNYLFILLIFLASIFPLSALLHPGLPITHDGQDHVARIANFYANLTEGVLIPRWAGNLNWGFGHPILMFLYPLPSYIASFFHVIGFSFVDSVKLVFATGFILSGLTMYLWLKEQFSETAGFVGALLYLFAPYRFVDLYVRGAIGEHTAFIFPPIILYCLLKLQKTGSYRYITWGALSLASLILSHNAISLMFLLLIGLYACYLLWQMEQKRQFIMQALLVVVFGFGLSAFFWLPAFAEGKYTLRDIVTSEDYSSRFVPFKDFLYGEWSYGGTDLLSKQIGIVQWVAVMAAIAVAVMHKKTKKSFYVGVTMVILFVATLFIMTAASGSLWASLSILKKFQFPWRFLSVSVFLSAMMGAYAWELVPKKKQVLLACLAGMCLLLVNKDYWHAKDYLYKSESFYSGIYNSTTDTGESAPIWSVRFMEKRAEARMEVIDGTATIDEGIRTNTRHEYRVNATQRSRIKENTLYFPGWKVMVDGTEVQPEFQDPANRGLMTFFIEPGEHTISITFGETKLRMLANLISLGCLFLLAGLGILISRHIWPQYR